MIFGDCLQKSGLFKIKIINNKMIKRGFIVFIVGITALISCNKKNKLDIDTSDIKFEVNIKRLDQDVFEIDPGNIEEEAAELINEYNEFFELYSARIIKLGNPYNKGYENLLLGFITDYTMNKVYQKTMEIYPDIQGLENEIEDAFKRYTYYFPERTVPAVYTYIGGFNQSIVVADSILGIGLDKYLGKDCEFYDRLGIANYLQQNMNKENVPFDAMRAWVSTEFVYNDSVDNLVNNLVYQGKIQYFLDAMFPNTADSLKIGFEASQIRWCIKNEKQMWNYLVENKLLFTTDYMTIVKHINPAPFTSGYPQESPGKASVWLGWQIVRAYMERNTDITLKELMLNDDYQKILSESRYEP